MARRPGKFEQSSEGDWTVSLRDGQAPARTVELETADLKELSVQGTIQPMTVELSTLDLQEVIPGTTMAEVGRIVGESTSVIVDLSDEPSASPPAASATPSASPNLSVLLPVARPNPTARARAISTPAFTTQTPIPDTEEPSGAGLVIVVYLVATIALGLSIYVRFFS